MNNSTLLSLAAVAALIVSAAVLCACGNKKTNVYAPRTSNTVLRPTTSPGSAYRPGQAHRAINNRTRR